MPEVWETMAPLATPTSRIQSADSSKAWSNLTNLELLNCYAISFVKHSWFLTCNSN